MGIRIKTIPDETLVSSRVHDLDPELLITTAQAGMLLGCGSSDMAERKRSGRPPPARQPEGLRTKVSYVLGEVLQARRCDPAPSNALARRALQDHIRGFPTFAAFLAEAMPDDEWPFAIVQRRPIDFFASLEMSLSEEDDCEWLSLDDYVHRLRIAAGAAQADINRRAIESRTDEAANLNPEDGDRL